MAQLAISAINDVLLEEIDPKLTDVTLRPRFFLDKVVEDRSDIRKTLGGRSYYTEWVLKTQKAAGMGPRGAAGDLPTHVDPKYDKARMTLCRWYSTHEYDGPLESISDVNEVTDSIAGGVKDIRDNIAYQQEVSFIGNGNAALAYVSGGANDGTYTTYTCSENEWWPGTRRLTPGLRIDSYDGYVGYGTGTIGLDSKTVYDIPSTTTFRVVEASETSIDADCIYFEDGSGTQVDSYPGGITQLIDGPNSHGAAWETTGGQSNASIENIDGTSLTYWQSYVSSAASARYLDDELLQDVADAIIVKVGEARYAQTDPVLLSNRAIQSRLRKDKSAENTWMNKTEMIAGIQVVKVQVNERELPWVVDEACGVNVLHWIDTNQLLFKALPMRLVDPRGYVQVIGTNGLGTDAYRMQYKRYSQLGIKARDTSASIRDLKTSG